MTTTVKVQPYGHRVRVTKMYKGTEFSEARVEEEVLEPNSPERILNVHSHLDVLIAEDTGQAKVPVVADVSFEDDLLSLEGEHGKNGGISPDDMISAYELRLYALREQAAADDDADAEA